MEIITILDTLLSLEQQYKENQYNGISTENNNFKIIDGTIPIVLSAPHAVKQNRDGNIKAEDRLTGAIVEWLCMKTGANGIIRTYNCNDDPNYENKGKSLKYKEKILELIKDRNIKLLVDIHGCTDKHGFDIELGISHGENINYDNTYLEIFKQNFSKMGKVVIDKKFMAESEKNISKFINRNSKIQCIQIEISKKFRKEQLIEMLEIFEDVIKKCTILFKGDINKEDDEISK